MKQRVGTCSICGGDVIGYRRLWQSMSPPPTDTCAQCGAVRREDIIEMRPRPAPHRNVCIVVHKQRAPMPFEEALSEARSRAEAGLGDHEVYELKAAVYPSGGVLEV